MGKGEVNGFQVDARFGGFFLHGENLKNHGLKVKMYYIVLYNEMFDFRLSGGSPI